MKVPAKPTPPLIVSFGSEMRNLIAGTILTFACLLLAWSILDFQGLQQYGAEGWPYDLQPITCGIISIVALVLGIAVIEKKPSMSRAITLALSIFAGMHFWISRRPADPYKDYGEDNFFRMIVNWVLVALVLLSVCFVERLFRRKRRQLESTEQSSASDAKSRDV